MVWGQKLLRTMRPNMKEKSAGQNRKPGNWRWFTGRSLRFLPQLWQTAQGADHVPVTEIQGEEPVGNLWYWVRSGFVITVGAGLIGIGVGLLALLAVCTGRTGGSTEEDACPA